MKTKRATKTRFEQATEEALCLFDGMTEDVDNHDDADQLAMEAFGTVCKKYKYKEDSPSWNALMATLMETSEQKFPSHEEEDEDE